MQKPRTTKQKEKQARSRGPRPSEVANGEAEPAGVSKGVIFWKKR